MTKSFYYGYATLCNKIYRPRFYISSLQSRHRTVLTIGLIILLFVLSAYLLPPLQKMLGSHFYLKSQLIQLQSLFLAIGGALIGATVIAFSFIMFAMQVNVERLPYGLFRKFSKDRKLIGAFLATFFLSIAITSTSLIPNKTWIGIAVLVDGFGTVLIVSLFLYAYGRALLLINPAQQLNIIINETEREMRVWVKRAERARPLFEKDEDNENDSSLRSTHDFPRTAYFIANPHWTNNAHKAIQHAIGFTRTYGERGDHEIFRFALNTIIQINKSYVNAKGKTFFASSPLVENPYSTDGLINDTLEHLRQNMQKSVTRRDEQQIEEILRTIAELVRVYAEIDYSNDYESNTHAHLAASYLSSAILLVAPHNMADVMMEGIRLLGQTAQLFISKGDLNNIVTLVDEIGVVACTGVAIENYRPVTQKGVEQIAQLTLALLLNKTNNISFAAGNLKTNMSMVTKLFLTVPDPPLSSIHSTYLGPYYSCISSEALGDRLRKLTNHLIKADADDETAQAIIRNFKDWAEDLYQTEKKLFLLAIEKRSHFTFDMIHWIANVTKLLLALSNAPACSTHQKEDLKKHALWLISSLSFVPDDQENMAFVEGLNTMEEVLFEVALEADNRGIENFSKDVRSLLLSWAFKAGRYQSGWGTLEESLYGLATLVLNTGVSTDAEDLKVEISNRLSQINAPDQEIRDRTARDIRKKAASLYNAEYSSSRIAYAMSQTGHGTMRSLLEEIANLLSTPST